LNLGDPSVCNKKSDSIASENRYPSTDAGDNRRAPGTTRQRSREQRKRDGNAKFAEDYVPGRE
jgi:hypothetical protein